MKKLLITLTVICVLLVAGAFYRMLTATESTEPLVDIGLSSKNQQQVQAEQPTTQPKDEQLGRKRVREMEQTSDFMGGGSSSPSGGTDYNATGSVNRAKKNLEKD